MVPQSVTRYLEQHHTPYRLRPHPRAVTAQETAAAIHEPGDRMAKALVVDADERRWIAVLPATELPFGGLYGLPVIADVALSRQPRMFVRAGSHEECVELSWSEFEKLEHPFVAAIGSRLEWAEAQRRRM